MICGLLWLGSFTKYNGFKVYPCWSTYQDFISFQGRILFQNVIHRYIFFIHSSVYVQLGCPNKHLAPQTPSQHLLLESPAWKLPTLRTLGSQLLYQWGLSRNSFSKGGSTQKAILIPEAKRMKRSLSYYHKYCRPTCWLLCLGVGLFGDET